MSEVTRLIDTLGLAPHPEGGYFREIHRASRQVQVRDQLRAASTSIYFLLPEDSFSAWHTVQSDEQWHHYGGAALELHLLDHGRHERVIIGNQILDGEVAQSMVPGGVAQAARPIGGWALMGCTVAPGFDFCDFALNTRDELLTGFSGDPALIDQFLRH